MIYIGICDTVIANAALKCHGYYPREDYQCGFKVP